MAKTNEKAKVAAKDNGAKKTKKGKKKKKKKKKQA